MCPFHRKPALTAKQAVVEKEARLALDAKRRSGTQMALADPPPAYHQLEFEGSAPVSPVSTHSGDTLLSPSPDETAASTLITSPSPSPALSPASLKAYDPCAWGHDTRPTPGQAAAMGALHVALFPFSLICEMKRTHLKCRNCGTMIERKRVQQ